MSFSKSLLLKVNKLFPLPVHPFNLQNEGKMTYAQWQFEKGADTIKFYTGKYSTEDMFKDKTVLDIGCGAAGKSLYYASLGAKMVHGADVVERYREESKKLSIEKGLEDKFEFHLCDAKNLEFENETFDTIIMNDSMEHVAEPEEVVKECMRVLKPGGRLFINFCPYHHPFGAHLSDVIGIPWVHLFFSEKTMIDAYKDLMVGIPDGEDRIKFRFSKDKNGKETISYINKMTVKRFNKIMKKLNLKPEYYAEIPLRSFFSPLAKLPLIKEAFVKMTVAVISK
ncbi:MAG: class I SAM-dependent methyltransferase [Ruminococcaceae bacterium]|nr:class I SAM-dependent methyltransferase [Oscillospiraceae bacterium]